MTKTKCNNKTIFFLLIRKNCQISQNVLELTLKIKVKILDARCAHIPRESMRKACNIIDCHPNWQYGKWERVSFIKKILRISSKIQCSVSCGRGVQKRSQICQKESSNGHTSRISRSSCKSEKLAIQQRYCEGRQCRKRHIRDQISWNVGTWSEVNYLILAKKSDFVFAQILIYL